MAASCRLISSTELRSDLSERPAVTRAFLFRGGGALVESRAFLLCNAQRKTCPLRLEKAVDTRPATRAKYKIQGDANEQCRSQDHFGNGGAGADGHRGAERRGRCAGWPEIDFPGWYDDHPD